MAQGSGAAPAVGLAAGGPIACPTRFPSIARPLPAIGGQFSVPMVAPGPEMQGHGGAPSRSWRAPGVGAGSGRALRPSQDGAGRGSLLRGGARAHGWLLRNGFQAAQGGDRPLHGEGAGVCGGKGVGCVRARPHGPWPQDPQRPGPHAHTAALCPALGFHCCFAHRRGPRGPTGQVWVFLGLGTAEGTRGAGPRYLALGRSQFLTMEAAWGQKEQGDQHGGGAGRWTDR